MPNSYYTYIPPGTSTPPPKTSGAIRNLQFASGDPGAVLSQSSAQSQQVAANTPVQNFNNQLLELLKSYQNLGTAPFVQQQYNAQTAQNTASNSALLNPSLRGYAPSTIMNAGQSAAAPYNPIIQGAQQGGQTFGEQIAGFGNTIGKVQDFVKANEDAQNKKRDDARAIINEILTTTDPASLKGLDPEAIATLEKESGYPKGFLSSAVTYKQQQADLAERKLHPTPSNPVNPTVPVTTDPGKQVNIPLDVAPYYATTHSGIGYVDGSTLQGSASEKKSIVDQATRAGIKVITNKNTVADLTNISDANGKLDTISKIMAGIAQPSVLSRDLYGLGLTKFASMAQSNPQQAAAGSLQSIGLDILKAISGVQGFRGNQTAVQQVTDHLPSIYDTQAVVQQKIDYIRQLINARENAIVGPAQSSSSGASIFSQYGNGQASNSPDYQAYLKAIGQ